MQRLRVFLKTSLLISLFAYAAGADAQPSSTNKKKIAIGPGVLAPSAVPGVRAAAVTRLKNKPALLKSSYPSSHMEKGFYFKQQKMLAEALLEFIRAAQENPRNTTAFYEQAQIFKEQGRSKLAKSAMEQALAVSPANTQLRSYLVQLHFESGNLLGAASEVGKMFTISENKPEAKAQTKPKEKISMQDLHELSNSTSAAVQIAKAGNLPQPAGEGDAASAWLQSASSPEKSTQIQAVPKAENSKIEDVLAGIGNLPSTDNASKSSKSTVIAEHPKEKLSAESKGESIAKLPSNSVADVLKSISGDKHKPGKIVVQEDAQGARAAASAAAAAAAAAAASGPSAAGEAGILARVRSGASKAVSKPTEWFRNRLPGGTEEAEKSDGQAHGSSMLSWMKDKLRMPFVANSETAKTEASAKTTDGKTTEAKSEEKKSTFSFVSIAHNMNSQLAHLKGKMPFVGRDEAAKPTAIRTTSTTTVTSSYQKMTPDKPGEKLGENPSEKPNTDSTNANVPPEVARILEGKFGGAVVTTSQLGQAPKAPAQDKAHKEMNEQLKQVLDSVQAVKPDRETPRPEISGPKYGLLKNNALAHISSSDPPALGEEKPSFLDNLVHQARKTFSSFVPSISWSWPSLPAIPILKRESPESIVASVPAPLPEKERNLLEEAMKNSSVIELKVPTAEVKNADGTAKNEESKNGRDGKPAAPIPVPLDVSRILNKLAANVPTAPAPAPIAPRLSASIPMAAAPSNIESMIPKSIETAAPAPAPAGLPVIAAQGLDKRETTSGPQSSPQQAAASPVHQSLPPVVQEIVNQAQPIIRPALEAATGFVQSIAPLAINKTENQAPIPVQSAAAPLVANNVPVPVGVDMSKYYPSVPVQMAPAGLSAGQSESIGGRKLIDIQKSKSGAFTFMKPIIDSDRSYLLGAKQIRTIQPLPVKAQAVPPPPPEDAITKRMRYLLEHGTTNLRQREAFMFSEETGEGTLFLPDGTTERRKLKESQDHDKIMRQRRPDIMNPKDLQYSLTLLGKLLPPQQQQQEKRDDQAVQGPSLEQLLYEMDQQKKGFFGWMKKSFGMNN